MRRLLATPSAMIVSGLVVFIAIVAPRLRAAVPEGGQKKGTAKAQVDDRDDAERPELKAAQEKVRKAVERAIGPRESKFYVVALSETSYHTGLVRTTEVLVGNQVDKKTEFKFPPAGGYLPLESVEFHIQGGRQPCIDFIVERMSPYLEGQLQSPKNKVEGQAPTATGNWKLLGRFKTTEKAQEAVAKAEAVYHAEPRWEAPQDKK